MNQSHVPGSISIEESLKLIKSGDFNFAKSKGNYLCQVYYPANEKYPDGLIEISVCYFNGESFESGIRPYGIVIY